MAPNVGTAEAVVRDRRGDGLDGLEEVRRLVPNRAPVVRHRLEAVAVLRRAGLARF
jgi:hypothetical protein